MRRDSYMAEQIELRLLAQGVIALPLYDSFIIPQSTAIRARFWKQWQRLYTNRSGKILRLQWFLRKTFHNMGGDGGVMVVVVMVMAWLAGGCWGGACSCCFPICLRGIYSMVIA
jgi:hypothetical protein